MSSKHEVVMIADNNLAHKGGAEINTRKVLGFGQPDTYWTVYSPFPIPEELSVEGHVTPPFIHVLDLKLNIIRPDQLIQTIHDIREKNPDAIVLNHPYAYGAQLFGLMEPDMRAKTVVVWRHVITDTLSRAAPDSGPRKIIDPLLDHAVTGLWSFVGKKSAGNIAFSNATKASLVNVGVHPDRIAVVQDQVGFEMDADLRMSPNYMETRRKFLEDDQLGVLSVGRINRVKNFLWVADAYGQLLASKDNLPSDGPFRRVKFTIAGPADSASEQAELSRVSERIDAIDAKYGKSERVVIEYIGSQTYKELYELYNTYDIQLLTSLFEGSSNVLKEAARGGMALMSAKQAEAAAQLITESSTLIGAPLNGSSDTALHIRNCLHNPQILHYMQDRALAWGEQFTQARAEREFWDAIRQFIH